MLHVHPNKRIFPTRPRVFARRASAPEDGAAESRRIITKRSRKGPRRWGPRTSWILSWACCGHLDQSQDLPAPAPLPRPSRCPRGLGHPRETVRAAKDGAVVGPTPVTLASRAARPPASVETAQVARPHALREEARGAPRDTQPQCPQSAGSTATLGSQLDWAWG